MSEEFHGPGKVADLMITIRVETLVDFVENVRHAVEFSWIKTAAPLPGGRQEKQPGR
jgi:hypothetical protein